MRALAALLCVILLAAGCDGDGPTLTPIAPASGSANPPPSSGPSFSGTYAVVAENTGDEGEQSWAATWKATPACAEGSCDSVLTISRPGFDTYQVTAINRGDRWFWRPVTTLVCPESGEPYVVAGPGFRMQAVGSRAIQGIGTVTGLEGEVVVVLRAGGCPTQHLRYAVTAERTG